LTKINNLVGKERDKFLRVLKDFKLEKSVVTGHLPVAYTDSKPEKYLESYVSTYLREEIQQEGLTRNLSAFSRFLEMASFSQGSLLTLSDVARDTAIERKVVENYFSILEDLLLASRLPVFTKRAKRRLVSHPKFYFFDTGVYQTLRPHNILDSEQELGGAALENLFLQNLLAVTTNEVDKYEVSYFRTVAGSEVDFVVCGKGKLIACEIKNSPRYNSSWLRGLKQFGKDYPEAELYLLYTGKERLYVGKIQVIPIGEYLREMGKLLYG